jgi:DNA-binding NtrC family response regulator
MPGNGRELRNVLNRLDIIFDRKQINATRFLAPKELGRYADKGEQGGGRQRGERADAGPTRGEERAD